MQQQRCGYGMIEMRTSRGISYVRWFLSLAFTCFDVCQSSIRLDNIQSSTRTTYYSTSFGLHYEPIRKFSVRYALVTIRYCFGTTLLLRGRLLFWYFYVLFRYLLVTLRYCFGTILLLWGRLLFRHFYALVRLHTFIGTAKCFKGRPTCTVCASQVLSRFLIDGILLVFLYVMWATDFKTKLKRRWSIPVLKRLL